MLRENVARSSLDTTSRSPSSLSQRNSRVCYGGKVYRFSRRFSSGVYPNRSQQREPETLRYSREWFHDGEGWKQSWDSEPINQGATAPYGLVNTSKSSQADFGQPKNGSLPCRRKGDTVGIPSVAKRRIDNAVQGLIHEHGRDCVGFATCTLPSMSADEMQRLNREFGRVCQVFFQRCKREAERCGVPWLYVAAYEIQEKRLQRWGQIAMHLHFVFLSRPAAADAYWLTKEKLTQFWGEALERFLGHPVPRSALTNVQACKSETGRELAKYQTKGSQVVAKVKAMGRADELPGQWWSMCKAMKEFDKANTFSLKGYRAEYLIANCDALADNSAIMYRPILKEIEGREIRLGIAGFFVNDEALGEFLLATSDDHLLAPDAPASMPRIGPTPQSMEADIATALAEGNLELVMALVDQADHLYPSPEIAKRQQSHDEFLWVCRQVSLRRENQLPKTVYGYNEHDRTAV